MNNDNRNLNTGRVRQPEAHGVRGADKTNPIGEDTDRASVNTKTPRTRHDRKDAKEAPTAPKTSKAPPRDTRDTPAPNPDGASEGKAPLTPKPTDGA